MNHNPPLSMASGLAQPRGVTISEVLISMMIMAIGVVSLAALFPASILRSAQASQLTNSAIVSKNARARLVYDGSILSNLVIPIPDNSSLDPVNPPVRAVIDPFGSLSKYGLPGNIAGVNRTGGSGTMPLTQQFAEGLALLPDSWSVVRQDTISGGYTAGNHFVTFSSAGSNFSDVTPRTLTGAGSSLPLYRLTLLDPTGRYAYKRTLRQILNGNQMSWEDSTGVFEADLPSSFTPAKARLEVQENRYTWMLTVRKRSLEPVTLLNPTVFPWKAEADLVVFFNRSFNATEEGIDPTTGAALQQMSATGASGGFDLQPGMAGVDDDLDGTVDNNSERGWPGTDDLRSLSFTTPAPVSLKKSGLKKGGFLFEPSQARWYRIINLDLDNGRILLDRDLIDPPGNPFDVVLMKGIVQVYELGIFSGSR